MQAHCHQRSLVGTGPMLKLLRRIPGAEVIDLDAGCCGMAGSFGYEAEHYEISRLVGEQRLLPAVRAGRARDRGGRTGVLVPAPDPALHRSRGGSSGRDASIVSCLTGRPASRILTRVGHGVRISHCPVQGPCQPSDLRFIRSSRPVQTDATGRPTDDRR